MTNKEAIKMLKLIKSTVYLGNRKFMDAIDMAIAALSCSEIPNNSDMVYRQALIDAFLTELTKRERKNLLHTWSTVEVKYFVTDMIERLPSAQHGGLVKEGGRIKKYSISVEIESDDSIVKELDNLQTYKFSENDDMTLVNVADVIDILVSHIKASDNREGEQT